MNARRSGISLLLGVAWTIAAGAAVAEEETADEGHGWHRHHVGLYAGGAYRGKHHENGRWWRASTSTASGASSAWEWWPSVRSRSKTTPGCSCFPSRCTPAEAFVWETGPGIEFEDGESGNFVSRFSLGRDFERGRNFFLTPAANADLGEGDWNFTYGIQLGYGF